MSVPQFFSDDHIIQSLEQHGCPWSDYILVGSPASICRFVDGSGLWTLLVEDDALADATVQFLTERGARTYLSFDEVKREFGWDGQIQIPSA